jgi:hypothetical protein
VPQPSQLMEFLPGQTVVMYPSVDPQLLVSVGPSPPGPALAPCPDHPGQLLLSRERHTYFVNSEGKVRGTG